MTGTNAVRKRSVRRWKFTVRVLQVMLGLAVTFAVWSIGFAGDDGPPPVLPNTETQFSLDLDVVDTYEHPMVYVVEQRARPAYRIFAFDPVTGVDETVFTVPEDAIIYGLAVSNDGNTLAVNYSPDYRLDGSGLWTLDVGSSEGATSNEAAMTQVVGVTEGIYLTDPSWSYDDGSVFATRVDRTGDDERLAVTEISIGSGSNLIIAEEAISPVAVDDTVYFLDVDENTARRSIGFVDADGQRGSIAVADGALDLDELLASSDGSGLLVSGIESDDGTTTITVGQPAEAHGNHDVPSAWWTVPLDGSAAGPLGTDEDVIYDAAISTDTIVSATREGLVFTSTSNTMMVPVIESRALRFVAG
ncbi:hypothetical protein [Ilumatobacter sp.]|uniref:hypothetical protein n=1 Tax=Ilumatobacter sp. TaxID=1967498 RepID=UPI003C35D5F3